MGLVRNNINIEGLSLEEELPQKVDGQLVTYSETESLYIPEDKPEAKDIYEISLEIDIKSKRTIKTAFGKLIVIDGVKKFKMLYAENNEASSASIAAYKTPYNTFFEVPNSTEEILDISVHILDAYFQLLDGRKIYSHYIFQLSINYDRKQVAAPPSAQSSQRASEDSLLAQLKEIHTVLSEAALTGEGDSGDSGDSEEKAAIMDEGEDPIVRMVYKPYEEVFL